MSHYATVFTLKPLHTRKCRTSCCRWPIYCSFMSHWHILSTAGAQGNFRHSRSEIFTSKCIREICKCMHETIVHYLRRPRQHDSDAGHKTERQLQNMWSGTLQQQDWHLLTSLSCGTAGSSDEVWSSKDSYNSLYCSWSHYVNITNILLALLHTDMSNS